MPSRPPAPAPRPVGELLKQLDPALAMRDAQVAALNDMVQAGRIDWQEWAKRVKDLRETPAASKPDELAEARATAAEARAHAQAEAARQRTNDERER